MHDIAEYKRCLIGLIISRPSDCDVTAGRLPTKTQISIHPLLVSYSAKCSHQSRSSRRPFCCLARDGQTDGRTDRWLCDTRNAAAWRAEALITSRQ